MHPSYSQVIIAGIAGCLILCLLAEDSPGLALHYFGLLNGCMCGSDCAHPSGYKQESDSGFDVCARALLSKKEGNRTGTLNPTVSVASTVMQVKGR